MNKSYRVIEEVLRLVGVSSHQNCPKSTISRGMGGDQCLCHDQIVLWYSLEETRHSFCPERYKLVFDRFLYPDNKFLCQPSKPDQAELKRPGLLGQALPGDCPAPRSELGEGNQKNHTAGLEKRA